MQTQEQAMEQVAERILELREDKFDLETKIKAINKELEDTEWQLINIMTDKELESFKHKGISFTVAKREFKSANPETKDELYLQFRNRGMDYLFSINANTLSAKVKELTEENDGVMPEWLDGLINTFEKQYISIRKN